MKEFTNITQYYDKDIVNHVSTIEYDNEKKRLVAENAANKKYLEDEKKKAEIEKANKENKEREEAARQKQREDRQARVETDKKIILQKNIDKKDLQEKRDEMANNYNKLSVRKKVALLNDGADMQLFIEEMIKDAFIDYTEGTLKKEIDELKPYNPKGNDDDSLEKGKTGVMGYDRSTGEYYTYQNRKIDAAYHGTGDLFSSTAVGEILKGRDWRDAMRIAADYTAHTIEVTLQNPKKPWYGVDFEATIPDLIAMD